MGRWVMARRSGKWESGQPATLGSAALAHLRLIVWCKGCRHQVEIATEAIEALAKQHGAETTLADWAARLRCSGCGSRDVDFVVSGARRLGRPGCVPIILGSSERRRPPAEARSGNRAGFSYGARRCGPLSSPDCA